ncbi:TPA: hypothetical protein ACUUA6_006439 [Pseudomonas aeruginosa]
MIKSTAIRIALTIASAALLHGCAGMRPPEFSTQVEGVNVSYRPRDTGLDRWINAQPVDLSVHETQTEKAMALFGYPKLSWYPEGRLTYKSTAQVAIIETPLYMRPTYGGPGDLKPQSQRGGPNAADSIITAGLGSGNAGLALVGALAGIGAAGENADPRTTWSHLLCYKSQADFDASAALQSCWSDWLGQMRSLPHQQVDKPGQGSAKFVIEVPTASQGNGRVGMSLARSRTQYFQGMAPVQMGGFKAHIFHFYPHVWALPGSSFTVEDLVAELGKNKPAALVYLIAGKADSRNRTGVDPVGVVD